MFYSPNAILKLKAKQSLKNNWQIALLVCFVASLPGIIGQVITIMTGGDFATRMTAGMEELILQLNAGIMPEDPVAALVEGMTAQFDMTYVYTLAASVVLGLFTPVLMLGMYHYLMELLRGKPGELRDVLSRGRLFLKAIGLEVLVWIKVLLWAVPGSVLLFGGSFAASAVIVNMESATIETVMTVLTVLTNASYFAILIPVIMATYRYAMAVYHLADHPDARLRDCIAESKQLMQRRKMSLFSLQISFIGWQLLIGFANMLLQSMFGYVIGSTVQMFLSLALSLYMETTVCCFYLALCNPAQLGMRRVNPMTGDDEPLN